jgi:hypothetical protein
MIGLKRDGSRASSIVDKLTGLFRRDTAANVPVQLGALGGSSDEVNWEAIKAAREFEAIKLRQATGIEKLRALVRRC